MLNFVAQSLRNLIIFNHRVTAVLYTTAHGLCMLFVVKWD